MRNPSSLERTAGFFFGTVLLVAACARGQAKRAVGPSRPPPPALSSPAAPPADGVWRYPTTDGVPLAMLPDGDMVFWDVTGAVRVVSAAGKVETLRENFPKPLWVEVEGAVVMLWPPAPSNNAALTWSRRTGIVQPGSWPVIGRDGRYLLCDRVSSCLGVDGTGQREVFRGVVAYGREIGRFFFVRAVDTPFVLNEAWKRTDLPRSMKPLDFDPEGTHVYGSLFARSRNDYVRVSLADGKVEQLGPGVPSEEAIRGKGRMRECIATSRGAVLLRPRSVDVWSADTRTTRQVASLSHKWISGLYAISPDEQWLLFTRGLVPLDGGSPPHEVASSGPKPCTDSFSADSSWALVCAGDSKLIGHSLRSHDERVLSESCRQMRAIDHARVLVCDRSIQSDRCELAIVDAASGQRTTLAEGVHVPKGDPWLDYPQELPAFVMAGSRVAYATDKELVVMPLP